MKVDDIRPGNMIQVYQELRSKDIENLMLHKDAFVEIACPACDSKNHEFQFDKEGFNFVICSECDTLFVNPRPSFQLLEEFYRTSKCIEYWDTIFSNTEETRRNQIFIPRAKKVIDMCIRHESPKEVFVDVGAGYGTFLEEIGKHGRFEKLFAIEPSKKFANACRKKNLNVIEEPVEKVQIEKVDVVSSFELIAHLFKPQDYLSICHKMLSKGGLLILTTPNIKGFDLLTLGKLHHNIAGPNHLNYFHPGSIRKLLDRCGFEVVEIQTPGKLDAEIVRNKVISGEFGIANQPFLKHILMDNWGLLGNAFQQFLEVNCLSSHLWVVARKK